MDALRAAIAAGEPTFGPWISIGDPLVSEILSKVGYDWVILDAQHGGVDWHNMMSAIQAYDLGGTRALVRVGWLDEALIMRAMDLGALGVVVPMVSTAAQALRAAQAIRYPPHGIRSYGPVRNYYAADGAAPIDPVCMVMIETAESLDNLDAIAATPGVDGLFMGPVDLAISLGLGPAMVMPDKVYAAVDRMVEACDRHGKIAGCAALGHANVEELLKRGMRFMTSGNDGGYLRRGGLADVEQGKAWKAAYRR